MRGNPSQLFLKIKWCVWSLCTKWKADWENLILKSPWSTSNGKKTGKPFIAEMLLRICVWISSCSWKAPYSLHTSRSVLYVRSLNTLAKFLTNHYRSNSLRNRSFSYFRSLSNFLDELTRKHLLRNLPRYLSDALLFLIDIYYSLFAANLPIGKISSLFDRRRPLSKNLLDKIVNSNSYNAMNS